MQLSSSARSAVVAAALAATAGFGLGAVFTSHSNADAYTQPASPAVATSEPTYVHGHPTRISPAMRRYMDAKRSKPQTGATAGRGADGAVRILPHDVKGP
jgi:hypothetical protein